MKKLIKKEVFSKTFRGFYHDVRFSDLPKNIKEDDIINIVRVDAFQSENNSWDEHSLLEIIREQEETDVEHQKRLAKEKDTKDRAKNMRYETYLKLKAEFEEAVRKLP